MGNYYSGMTNATGGSELRHHGILGQKWGVRRFQNKDGSLTNAGRERYGYSGVSEKKYQYSEAGKQAYSDMSKVLNRYYRDEGYSSDIGGNYYSKMSGEKPMTKTDEKIMKIIDDATKDPIYAEAQKRYYQAVADKQKNKNPFKDSKMAKNAQDAYKEFQKIDRALMYNTCEELMKEIKKLPKAQQDEAMCFAYVAIGGDW